MQAECKHCGKRIYQDAEGVWHHEPPVPRHIPEPKQTSEFPGTTHTIPNQHTR